MSLIKPYTYEEKQLLVQIIKQHPLIEEKRTDDNAISNKRESWDAACVEFNSTTPTHVKVY